MEIDLDELIGRTPPGLRPAHLKVYRILVYDSGKKKCNPRGEVRWHPEQKRLDYRTEDKIPAGALSMLKVEFAADRRLGGVGDSGKIWVYERIG